MMLPTYRESTENLNRLGNVNGSLDRLWLSHSNTPTNHMADVSALGACRRESKPGYAVNHATVSAVSHPL